MYKSFLNTSRLRRSWTGELALVNFLSCAGMLVQVETNSPDHIFAGLGPLVLANLPQCQSLKWCGFIYLFGVYVVFNTVQVISRRVVGRAEETSTYSSSGFCTVNCRPTASNYQLSHLRPCQEPNPGLRGGRRECYHSATVAPCGGVE